MTDVETVFEPPHLQGQPATRKKLAYSGAIVLCLIGLAAVLAHFMDLSDQGELTQVQSALQIMAIAAVVILLALLINVFNKYTDLAEQQLRAELSALPDSQLLLCGQLKNHVPNEEWQVIRSVLRERWEDWDVRLSELITSAINDDRRGSE